MKAIPLFIIIFSLLLVVDLQAQQLYKKRYPADHPVYNANNYKHPNKAQEAKKWNSGSTTNKVSFTVTKGIAPLLPSYKQINKAAKKEVKYQAIQTEQLNNELNPYLSPRNYKDQRSYTKRVTNRLPKKAEQEANDELVIIEEATSPKLDD